VTHFCDFGTKVTFNAGYSPKGHGKGRTDVLNVHEGFKTLHTTIMCNPDPSSDEWVGKWLHYSSAHVYAHPCG
jgi:hypothetical protein